MKTLEAFAEWCESKGDEVYNYMDPENCACAQYCRHIGIEYDVATARRDGTFMEQIEWASISGNVDPDASSTKIKFSDLALTVRQLAAEKELE